MIRWLKSWFTCWHKWDWKWFDGPRHEETFPSGSYLAWVQHYGRKTCKKCGKIEWHPREPDEEIKPRNY